MKKNVASQAIGAQMIATNGSDFTGTVTVYITGDSGSQAIGSVGSGACTHKGHGYHQYAPAQAETNFDHATFTFIGTGAITATVQMYPTFPQTGDNFARIGAPVGASISADVAAAKTDTAAIKGKTDNHPSDPADASDIVSAFSTVNGSLTTIASYIDTEVGAIKAKTDNIPSDPADASDIASAFSTVNSTLATIAGYIDTEVGAIKAKTDNLPSDPADQSLIIAATDAIYGRLGAPAGASIAADIGAVPTAVENADALLTRDWTGVTGEAARSVLNALRFVRNRWFMSGTTLNVTKENDSTTAWTAEVSTTPGADPITGTDPS